MSNRQQFLLPNVTPGTRVRFDTASGSYSAADVVDNLNQAISGSILTGDKTGRLASGDLYGPVGVTTLYMKTLDGSGNVTGSPTTLASAHPASASSDPRVDAILAGAPADRDTFGELPAVFAPILTPTGTKTAAYTAAPGDLVPVSTAGGAVTVTLPAAPANGARVAVKHTVQGGTNAVTIAAGGTDHFNTASGPTSATLTMLNQAVQLQYAAGVWLVVADDLPLSQLDSRFLKQTDAAGAFAPIDARDTSITQFAVGMLVASGSTLYKVTTAHAAPFDTAKATSVGGGGSSGWALQHVASTVSANGAAVVNKHNPVDATGAARTITLPTGQSEGTTLSIEKIDASTNPVSITGSIRGVGATSIVLSWFHETLTLLADSAGSWWPVSGHKTKTALDAVYVSVFHPEAYGALGDGTTDDSVAVLAACQAAYNAGGGEVLFRAGKTYKMLSQLRLPDSGDGTSGTSGTQPTARPIRLKGEGGSTWDGMMRRTVLTGATLDLRYNGTEPAKIDTRGTGFLEVTGLTITNLGTADTKPFFFGTNTTCWIHHNAFIGHSSKSGSACDQDAIVFGGTDTKTYGPAATDFFAGYGTIVEVNYFDRIRRGVWGRASFNANTIRGNFWSNRCGATSSEAAIDLDGMSATGLAFIQGGNQIQNNLFEIDNYPYLIRVRNSAKNQFHGNGFYDYIAANLTAVYKFLGEAALMSSNTITDAYYETGIITDRKIIETSGIVNGTASPLLWVGQTMRNAVLASGPDDGPVLVQPDKALAANSTLVFNVRRATQEASNQNADLIRLQNDGNLRVQGPSPGVNIGASGVGLSLDVASIVKVDTGNFDLYAGTASSNCVRIQRGGLKLYSRTTALRPAAAGVGAGAVIYDSDLGLPIFSDGTSWKKFDGSAA